MKGLLILLAVVALGLAASFFLFKPLPPKAPSAPSGSPEASAPAGTSPPAASSSSGAPAAGSEAADRQSLDAFFTEMGKVFQSGRGEAIGERFDYETMFDLLAEERVLPSEAKQQRERIVQALRLGMNNQFAATGHMMAWNAHEIRALRWLSDDHSRAAVYLRVASVMGVTAKYRWWAVRRNNVWRTYDMEDLGTNIRISTMMGMGFAAGLHKNAWGTKVPQFMQASQAVALGDLANADLMLSQLEGVEFPPVLESLRLMLTGAVRLQQGKWQEAIDSADRAEKLTGDAPVFNQLRAAAYGELKQPEKALACAQKYIDLLGADADILSQVALARAQSGQAKEAEQAFVDGLKDDPQSFFCLLQYAKFLPKERKGEIAAPFAKLKDPDEMLDRLGKTLSTEQDADTLLAVCAAYRAVKPDSGKEKQYEKIAELLRNAAPAPAPDTKTETPGE